MKLGSSPKPSLPRQEVDDLWAMLGASNARLRELTKEVVYLNGVVWEMQKRLEGDPR